jgi:hypothetical protein
MQKYNRFFIELTIRVLIISATLMVFSYVTSYLQSTGFFGDTIERGYFGTELGTTWGYRHHVWWITGVILFGISVARTIIWGQNFFNKNN